MYQVHVYKADSLSNCKDLGKGTLHFSNLSFTVLSDSELSVLYTANIPETLYERDQNNLLRSISKDFYFIEFSKPDDLSTVWEELKRIQSTFPTQIPTMPDPIAANLPKIAKILEENEISELLSETQIDKFVENLCKAVDENEDPKIFFPVFKILINSCSEKVFKEFLAENNFLGLLKVLEIDPELREKREYREWFRNCTFNNVLEVKDEDFIELVQLNFRIGFFKDNLLTKTFEERVAIVLNSFGVFISEEIIRKFVSSADIRAGLVIQMSKGNEFALRFFKTIVGMAKSVIATNCRIVLYETFFEDEILNFFPLLWRNENCQKIVVEMIFEVFCAMAWNLKQFFLDSFGEISFFEEFCVRGMDLEIDEVFYVGETLKLLFDNIKELDFSQILGLFFTKVLGKFIEKLGNEGQSEVSKCEILMVLTVLLQNEPNEAKIEFVMGGLFVTIQTLLKKCNSTIKVAIYKLFKIVVKANDSYLISYFIKLGLFEQVFVDLYESLSKENLIFSLTFGILQSIFESSNKDLLIYVNKEFRERFQSSWIMSYFTKIDEKIQKIHGLPLFINKSLADFDMRTNENFSDIEDLSKPIKRQEHLDEFPQKKKLN